jgi:hypothetical protein
MTWSSTLTALGVLLLVLYLVTGTLLYVVPAALALGVATVLAAIALHDRER